MIRVADTGVGMDEEALARVFEPYFSTKTTGTGLGLPIARRNVELSGGAIEVESAKGAGRRSRAAAATHGFKPPFAGHVTSACGVLRPGRPAIRPSSSDDAEADERRHADT